MESIKLYTVAEAAELLRVTPRSICNFCNRGLVTAHKVGHQWRIPEAGLEELARRGSAAPKQAAPKSADQRILEALAQLPPEAQDEALRRIQEYAAELEKEQSAPPAGPTSEN